MRRALAIWCLLLVGVFCVSQSERTSAFWQSRDSNYNRSISGGAPGYVGPGDIATFIGWWGLRAYSAATAGNKAISLYKSSDGYTTPHDVATVAGTGALNIADPFFDGSTYKINTFYDQIGTNDIVTGSSTAGNFTLTGGPAAGAKAVTTLGNGADFFGSISFVSLPQPYTLFAVAQRTGAFTSAGPILTDLFGFDNASNLVVLGGSPQIVQTAADSAFHTILGQEISGTNNSLINVDGGTDSVGTLVDSLSGVSFYLFANTGGGRFTGKFQEVGIIASGPNSTVRNSLITNAKTTYWGF